MTEAVLSNPWVSPTLADKALRAAATTWFVVTAFGQWIFVAYVLAYYGPMIFQGGAEALSESHLPRGFVPGDAVGNAAVVAHLLLAIVIIGGGPLQLIPTIRARFPRFHHWLGRVYLLAAVTTSVAGLYMIWTRGSIGGMVNQISISLDGVLIIVFAILTVRHAMLRNLRAHRRWALRLFMVVSGVWFFRVGLMAWVMATGGVGVDFQTFSGPFIYFWSFAQYLLPLAMLELYFRAQDQANASPRFAMAGGLMLAAGATVVGVFAAAGGMWLPRL